MSRIPTATNISSNGTGNSTDTSRRNSAIPPPLAITMSKAPLGRGMKRPNPPESDQPSGAAKRSRILPRKTGLRLFTRDFKFALPLAPSQTDRMEPGPAVDEATEAALGQCVDVALKLLEEGRGNTVLVNIGKQIVAERREASWAGTVSEAGIYRGDIQDMPMWVARFLGQVRQFGIPICVCDSLIGYGLTQRWAWGGDMEDYDCRNSAVVYIHRGVSVPLKLLTALF